VTSLTKEKQIKIIRTVFIAKEYGQPKNVISGKSQIYRMRAKQTGAGVYYWTKESTLPKNFVEENSFLFNLEKVAAESGKLLMLAMPIRWSTLTSMKRWRRSWCHNPSRATTKLESLPFNSKMFPKMHLIQVYLKIETDF
jgi:hypothetical protein